MEKSKKTEEESIDEWLNDYNSYYAEAYNQYLQNAKPLTDEEKSEENLCVYELNIEIGERKKIAEFEIKNI
jgi:hypothetical protein